MKRFHIHVAVTNLEDSIDFCKRSRYGRQSLRVSGRSSAELQVIRAFAEAVAAGAVPDQSAAACCYAKNTGLRGCRSIGDCLAMLLYGQP